jgi:hypothetical protein
MLEQDQGKFPREVFVVKQSIIHDEWKKRRTRSQALNKRKSELSPAQRTFVGAKDSNTSLSKV